MAFPLVVSLTVITISRRSSEKKNRLTNTILIISCTAIALDKYGHSTTFNIIIFHFVLAGDRIIFTKKSHEL